MSLDLLWHVLERGRELAKSNWVRCARAAVRVPGRSGALARRAPVGSAAPRPC